MNTKMLLALCGVIVLQNSALAQHPFSPTRTQHSEQQPVKFGVEEDQKIQRPIPVKK
jgi:hypothetical protein